MSDGNITVRPARAADLEAIVDLLANDPLGQGREDNSRPLAETYVQAFRAIEADPNQLLAVAEGAGGIVGCLQLSFIPGLARLGMWRGQIEGVRIDENARGRGLGRILFEWAIERCGERGCGLVQLTTDKTRPEAHRFYESLGFEATHEGMKLGLG